MPPKSEHASKEKYSVKTKQIMPMNQAIMIAFILTKFQNLQLFNFGPISNFARSLQATSQQTRRDRPVCKERLGIYNK